MAVWSGEANVTLEPAERAEAAGMFLAECRAVDGGVTGTFFEAGGLLVDLQHTGDVVGELRSHTGFAAFGALFGESDGSGYGRLAARLEGSVTAAGNQVVLIGHVVLASAWRGHGGVGRLLVSRMVQWLCAEPGLIAVAPFAATSGQEPHHARRTWPPSVSGRTTTACGSWTRRRLTTTKPSSTSKPACPAAVRGDHDVHRARSGSSRRCGSARASLTKSSAWSS
ncbi:hypothetical protein ACWEOE_41040 [Amycolatopsis sp. NPDC004368]